LRALRIENAKTAIFVLILLIVIAVILQLSGVYDFSTLLTNAADSSSFVPPDFRQSTNHIVNTMVGDNNHDEL